MSISPRSYSNTVSDVRGVHADVQAWLDGGPFTVTEPLHLQAASQFFEDLDTDSLRWNGTRGIVRANLFIGDTLAAWLRPQIVVANYGGANDTAVNSFDFDQCVQRLGVVSNSDRCVNTGVTQAQLRGDTDGGCGMILTTGHDGINFWEGPMLSYYVATASVCGMRFGNTSFQGFWGGGGAAFTTKTLQPGDVGSCWGDSGASRVLINTVNGTNSTAVAPFDRTESIYVLGGNNSGTVGYLPITQIFAVGGYFIWAGTNTTAQRNATVTALRNFGINAGRSIIV